MSNIVVIGAGQAGASLVAKLRSLGHAGPITLIGEEPVPPYQRPPLSKAYLLGDMELERLFLRPEAFYAEQDITLMTGTHVTAIDRTAKTITANDKAIPYDQLAFTTGSTPRKLPAAIGGDLQNVFTVRTLADVDAMAPSFKPGAKALIVGGGYIGLEAAAVAAKSGMEVTLVEASDRILQRVAAPETSDYFRALHQSKGVTIHENTGLDHLTGGTTVTGAILSDGTELAADIVIVGIGIIPNADLADAAGITLELGGIKTDIQGRTNDPAIYAAGDCACLPYKGNHIRLESVQNAIDQAEAVAENMLGANKDYEPKPWFWSDQYDTKLQIAGLNIGYDRIITRDTGEAISFWYYQGDTLLAVDAMNDGRAYMVGKRLIESGKSPDPAIIADSEADLKPLLRA